MYMENNETQMKGDKAELTAIYYYGQKGCLVSKPLQHSPYYDILVDDGKRVYKVEVKYTSYKRVDCNSFSVDLRTRKASGKRELIKTVNSKKTDLVFILDADDNIYEFKTKTICGMVNLNLNNKRKEFIKKM